MHLMVDAVDVLHDVLKSVADVNPCFMETSEKAQVLIELSRVEARVAELRLRVLAVAGDVAERDGARDAGAWVAHATHQRRSDAASDLRVASALDTDRPILGAALREGLLSLEQAKVIHHRLNDLPSTLPPQVVERAEAALVGYATRFDPTTLHRLGKKILHTVAPDIAERHEARALADLEADARQRQRLVLRSQGDGTTRLSALLPDPVAARLATYLHSFTNPRRHDDTTLETHPAEVETSPGRAVQHLPYPRRAAEAFGQLLEAVDPARLPIHGGDATTVVVTLSLDSLRDELGTATLDNGLPGDSLDTITAGEARRLACTAHLLPAVLGGTSTVLDYGRRQRLFSPAQRGALALAQKQCRTDGCTIPASWCEAHHRDPWSRGGRTDLDDGDLLCSHHHHLVHDPRYAADRLPDGSYRFHLRR